MSHNCGSGCKRKTGARCETCRRPGGRVIQVGKQEGVKRHHATPEQIGAAVDMYFDGLSYRRTAENMGQHLGRDTEAMTVYRWVQEQSRKADEVVKDFKSPVRTTRAAHTALSMARNRSSNAPKEVKTDGLRSYREAVPRTFPTSMVKHVVSKGIRAQINNNLSERLQGTFRDRDKTLRGLKLRDSGQTYVDGLVLHYNYFRPHESLVLLHLQGRKG